MRAATPDPDDFPELYADIPLKRLFAWAIDSAIIFGIVLIVVLLTFLTGLLIWPLLWAVVGFTYRVVTLKNGSATLGMRLMGMEIRSGDDRPLDLNLAIFHSLGLWISTAMPLIQVASIVMICVTARHQSLTDHVLGTVPMNRRAR
ncbi:MAG: RDD family protein [Sulfitobacter sp.]